MTELSVDNEMVGKDTIINKKHKISIPKYSLGEELISSISHGLGAAFGIVALVVSIVVAASNGNGYGVVASCIYGASLIILYTMSCIYHALKVNKGKRVFRVFDHCSIFLLIAGTYTPFTLVPLRGAVGWTLFGIIWGLAVLGITFNAINVEKYGVISMIAYLAMGWAVVLTFKTLAASVTVNCIRLLVAGGVAYTVGAIVYGIGSKVKYMHSIWHFFVLAGSILHFFAVLCVL